MIIIATGILIIIFIIYITAKCCIIPKRELNRYHEALKKLGYKVHAFPFKPFTTPFIDAEKESLKTHNDSCYITKRIAPACDVILTNSANNILLVFTSPDLIKQFCNAEKLYIMEKSKIITSGLKAFAGKGLFTSEGNEWKIKRKILSKVFNFELIKSNIPEIAKICDSTLDQYEQENGQISEQAISVFSTITNRIVLKCFFGEDDFRQKVNGIPFSTVIVNMVEQSVRIAVAPLFFFLGEKAMKWGLTKQIRDFRETINIFNSICKEIVKRRTVQIQSKLVNKQSNEVCRDLLEALIIQKKRCQAQGQLFVYTEEDIIQQFATFVVAGTGTSSNLIALMVYYICSNSHIEARLRGDIQKHIKTDEDYTFEKLKQLTYLDYIEKETSRFYGPATFLLPKKVIQDTQIAGIPMSKGTLLTYNKIGPHYRQQFYKNPYQFQPERWEQQSQVMHPYSFIPFGGGPRTCIGKQLAYLQCKIIVVKLFKRYKQIIVPKEIKLIDGFLYYAQKLKIRFIR